MFWGSIQLDIENSIECSIEFYRVSHSTAKLNIKVNTIFNIVFNIQLNRAPVLRALPLYFTFTLTPSGSGNRPSVLTQSSFNRRRRCSGPWSEGAGIRAATVAAAAIKLPQSGLAHRPSVRPPAGGEGRRGAAVTTDGGPCGRAGGFYLGCGNFAGNFFVVELDENQICRDVGSLQCRPARRHTIVDVAGYVGDCEPLRFAVWDSGGGGGEGGEG